MFTHILLLVIGVIVGYIFHNVIASAITRLNNYIKPPF